MPGKYSVCRTACLDCASLLRSLQRSTEKVTCVIEVPCDERLRMENISSRARRKKQEPVSGVTNDECRLKRPIVNVGER